MYDTFIRNKAMTSKHEIKSQLAKLLATEDLVVEHKQVETACFNVHTRVLTLPNWDKASNVVYDLLVGHEVGHALFTPDIDWIKDRKIPPQFVNVVEDVRIEKLMKRKYPGLPKTFYRGYKELHEKDFFAVEDDDVTTYNLADRINLHYKVGSFLPVVFSEEEKAIVNMVDTADTFEDVLDAAEALYAYCKQEKEKNKLPELDNLDVQNQTSGQGSELSEQPQQPEDGDVDDDSETQESKNEIEESTGAGSGGVSDPSSFQDIGQDDEDPEVKTESSLEEKLKDLIDRNKYNETLYLEVPDVNLKSIVVPNKEVHKVCNTFYEEVLKTVPEVYDHADTEYEKFKKSAQKEVNYLVKEFECRKSASSYARATVSRTGVLDTGKLHTYKFNEDLFKKVTVLPDGKNHGLIFVCDWSGSMGNVLLDTIKQMFQLVWFCKKVQIPFDVYAFTTEWWSAPHDKDGQPLSPVDHYEKREGIFAVHEMFNMLQILNSEVSNRELETQLKNIWRVGVHYTSHYYGAPIPSVLQLCGTPLNEAIISLFKIIPDFKKRTNAEKVNVVILTDGESNHITRHRTVQRSPEHVPYIGIGQVPYGTMLRDRKLGTTYDLFAQDSSVSLTQCLLRNLSERFPNENMIGIRVCEGRDFYSHLRHYIGYGNFSLEDKLTKQWKKEKAVAIPSSSYKKYFTLSATALSQDSEFEVAEDATKAQIRSAFKKSLGAKKTNKKILSQFIELVA